MTAEEILVINNVFGVIGTDIRFNLNLSRDCYIATQHNIKKAMQEYARLKCQELLLLVAEKAKVKVEDYNGNTNETSVEVVTEHNYEDRWLHDIRISFDKDSILNAVDLETFCS